MKQAIICIIWFTIWYVLVLIFYSSSPHRSYDPDALPTKMEIIGCHARLPLSEDCRKSILKGCTSDIMVERIDWAWSKWRDRDFILTVSAESMWDENAVGDKVDWEYLAFWFCQVRVDKNKWWYDRYKAMWTWQERLTECHRMYSVWKEKGIVSKRLYGYNVRHLNKLNIICQ